MSLSATLPFFNVTNIELYNLLETTERRIHDNLNNQTFTKHVLSMLPTSSILDNACKYHTTENFLKDHSYDNKQTRFLHLNIRSLDKHMGELLALIDALGGNFDIIALSEIGTKNIENREALLAKYGYGFRYKMPDRCRGGVGILFKKCLTLNERADLSIASHTLNGNRLEIENIWYEIQLPGSLQNNLIIGVIYKHPGCTVECLDYFTQQLENRLEQINTEIKKCVILGDFNIDGMQVNANKHVNSFFNAILEQNFIPTITIPTRINEQTATAIDNILINTKIVSGTESISAGNIYCDISDHLPSFLILKNKRENTTKNRPYVRIYGDKNMTTFKSQLQNTNWDELLQEQNEEEALDMFYTHYNSAFYKSFPLKRLSRKRAKDKKWMTKGLRISIHQKNKLYHKSITKPTDDNKSRYKNYRNMLNNCLRRAEEKYFHDVLTEEKQNLKTLWEITGDIINPKKMKRNTTISKLQINGETLTDDLAITNAMNDFFTQIGQKLAGSHGNSTDYKEYLNKAERNKESFYLYPVSIEETVKEISKLKSNKAGGDDGIKPKLLKECKDILAKPIAHIINTSFKNGRVPTKLKIAKVIPIYKKKDRTNPDNYRPISLLSTINKIMEKLMYTRVIKFLNKHKILYAYQFGFRKDHSTTLAIIEIVDNILGELAQGKIMAGIYLDLSKAFDTVDHNIMLHKLEYYGIRGAPLDWFKSYLNDRKQYTQLNNNKSELKHIRYGVPQGSVLGPLLFLVYINDIIHAVKPEDKLRLFADDSNIFVTAQTADELKENMIAALQGLFHWFGANKLTINVDKTAYTIFTKHKQIPSNLNNVKIGQHTIKRVHSVKYLGIILDDKLNWKDHIEELMKSLNKITKAFQIIKNYIPTKNKIVLYHAHIYSRIQYGIEVYSSAKEGLIKRVQVKQNKALKILYNKSFLTPTIEMHKEQKVLLVKDIAKLNILKFVFKQRNEITPEIFSNYFRENQCIHYHNTRQSGNIHIPSTGVNNRSIKHRGAKQWNSIPKEFRQIGNIKAFARAVKNSLISKY